MSPCEELHGDFLFLREFSKQNDLLPQNERTQVYGFDRSQSSKATWAARKAKIAVDKGLTNKLNRGIINNRNMNGSRRERSYILNDDDIKYVTSEAEAIGVPPEILRFNSGRQTGFNDFDGIINIRGDVFPDTNSHNNRDLLSVRAALAHEYYGHYKAHPSPYPIGYWQDEFNARYNAAVKAPNLSDEDRARLMIDAYERASEAGKHIEYDDVARRMIYGI